jgi:hypothetical protein
MEIGVQNRADDIAPYSEAGAAICGALGLNAALVQSLRIDVGTGGVATMDVRLAMTIGQCYSLEAALRHYQIVRREPDPTPAP